MVIVPIETTSATDGPPTGGTLSDHMRPSSRSRIGHREEMGGGELHEILALAGQHGLSYNDIAQKCRVSKSAVSRWAGGTRNPKSSHIKLLRMLKAELDPSPTADTRSSC